LGVRIEENEKMVQEEKRVDLKDNTDIVCPHQGVEGVMLKKEEGRETERDL
jgi:hypothetical protein